MHPLSAALLVCGWALCLGTERWGGEADAQQHGEWTASIEGGQEVAQLVALQAGYVFLSEVLGFPDTYLLRRDPHALRRRDPAHPARHLAADDRVKWAEPLFDKTRVKRYTIPDSERPLSRVKRIQNVPASLETVPSESLSDNSQSQEKSNVTSYRGRRRKRGIEDTKQLFNDELWSQQWYLQDTRTRTELPRLDLNVLPLYQAGINGKGVRVVVLDDGIEHQHSDLRDNYDPEISWDCNDGDPDPAPRNDDRLLNSHGTRCAGEIAMVANNGKCGVGAAWGARVGGVRMLDGRVNDRVEGEALGFAWDKVDIYSASWGPNDDGRTLEGPGRLAQHALERGVTMGRQGKGVIFVWANGNGGSKFDNCNCDGYSSSIYTVSIGSASQHGRFPWYGETCPSTMAAAYSSGAYGDQKIATTDVGDSCTLKHTGTSAAAPLAAGIIALALQANPALTWRDVQHLLAWTSEQAPLADGSGWRTNSAGLRYDVRFGFGVLNAAALVAAALNWTTVPDKTICHVDALPLSNSSIESGTAVNLLFPASGCAVEYLEHAELVTNVRYSRRGALEIQLTSPQGTGVVLLSPRRLDTSAEGFVGCRLSSLATWGERPRGCGTPWFGMYLATVLLQVSKGNSGTIGPCVLVLHGTAHAPDHMKAGPRTYNDRYNSNSAQYGTNDIIEDKNMNSVPETHSRDDIFEQADIDSVLDGITDQQALVNVLNEIDNSKGTNLKNMDARPEENSVYPFLTEVEKALLRVHHRMAKVSEEVK